MTRTARWTASSGFISKPRSPIGIPSGRAVSALRGVPCAGGPLKASPQPVDLRFGHGSLELQEELVILVVGVVDPLLVDHRHAGHPTDGMTTMSLRKWRSAGRFSRRPMPACRTGLAYPQKKRSARSDEGGGPREGRFGNYAGSVTIFVEIVRLESETSRVNPRATIAVRLIDPGVLQVYKFSHGPVPLLCGIEQAYRAAS